MSRTRSIGKGSVRALRAAASRWFAEPLEPRVMLSTIVINGTAGNDTINLFTGRDFAVIGAPFTVNWTVNGGPSQFAIPANGDSVDVKASDGADTVNIQSTLAGIPTLVEGDSGFPLDDTLNIGDSNGVQDIKGVISLGFGAWQINVNDQGDTAARNATINYDANRTPRYAVTGLAPAAIDAGANFDARGLTIQTDAVPGNVVNMQQVSQVPTTVVGNAAGTLNVQYPGFSDPVGISKLTLSNPSSPWNINFDDSMDSFGRKPAFASGSLTFPGDSPSPTYWNPAEVHSIKYNTSPTAGSIVDVTGVASTTTLNINGTGADTVRIGRGNVQNITGDVSVSSGFMGNLTLAIDDSADSAARTPTISTNASNTQITGLAPGTIAWQSNRVSTTVDGGSGGNTFAITALPLTSPINPPSFMINTGSGNDTVAMNYATGGILGNVVLDGLGGSNILIVVGSGPTDPFGVTPTTITHLGQTTTYSNFNVMVLDPGIFTVSGDMGGMSLTATGTGTTVQLLGNKHLGTLTVEDGTRVTMADGGATPSTLFCGIIIVHGSGKLDLGKNSLQLNYAGTPDPVAMIRTYLASGAITSSFADGSHALGLGDGADGVVPNLRAGTLLVRLTRLGDLNLDGTVNFADVLALAQHYGQSGVNWDQGDLNGDGRVSFPDVLALAQNYGQSATTQTALTVAPAAAALLLDGPIGSRRRKG